MIFKKDGFKPQFWVANIMELFERLAYYGQATILSIFLRDHLKFSEIEAGQLSSLFGGLIYLLPIFAGALADKFGFRKAFSFAFLVLAIGYFLIGSTGMKIFSGFYSDFDSYWMLFIILIFTAIGGSFIKPSVLGTVAVTTTHETKSLGYAIYYWLVNTGAAVGPILAFLVRDTFGIEFVYLVSAISCALMFFSTRFFFKDPTIITKENKQDLKTVFMNLVKVLGNFRFITFLLIFGLYWVLFWQFFIIIPFYVADFISPDAPIELLLSTGAWTIIIFQIPLNRLTNKIPTSTAIVIGFVLATLCWVLWYFALPAAQGVYINPWGDFKIALAIPLIVLGIFIFSIGEQTQAPRFYEYIADVAPKGQAALFQGYAFLPIAIAWGFGGTFGGRIYQIFVKNQIESGYSESEYIFLTVAGIGVISTLLMYLFIKGQKFFDRIEDHRKIKFSSAPDELGFNWGAFLITPVWLLFHKRIVYALLLLIIPNLIIYLTGIIAREFSLEIILVVLFAALCISAHFGTYGNKIAWINKGYSSINELKNKQKKWLILGLIYLIIGIGLLVYSLLAN